MHITGRSDDGDMTGRSNERQTRNSLHESSRILANSGSEFSANHQFAGGRLENTEPILLLR